LRRTRVPTPTSGDEHADYLRAVAEHDREIVDREHE
jgi:hypothetical protein